MRIILNPKSLPISIISGSIMLTKIRPSILIGVILLGAAFQRTLGLRAQQNPCYEFLCAEEESYLCGSDGVTYLNGCKYSQAKCKNPSLFITIPGPCLSSEDDMYINNTATDSLTTPGSIVPITDCDSIFCKQDYNPVCGNDDITYSNLCHLSKAQCRTSGLDLKHSGKCKSNENCMLRICPLFETPVCASNGKTYRNQCELSIAKCFNPSLNQTGNGVCPEEGTSPDSICNQTCEDQYRPVCATNGKTYPNICYFEIAKCEDQKLKIYKFEPC